MNLHRIGPLRYDADQNLTYLCPKRPSSQIVYRSLPHHVNAGEVWLLPGRPVPALPLLAPRRGVCYNPTGAHRGFTRTPTLRRYHAGASTRNAPQQFAVLLQIQTLNTPNGRELLLLDWPPALRASLTTTNTLAVDLNDIIYKAINWPAPNSETPPLILLLENAHDLVTGSALEQPLRALLAQIRQELTPTPAPILLATAAPHCCPNPRVPRALARWWPPSGAKMMPPC
jgi:hypothetical protein